MKDDICKTFGYELLSKLDIEQLNTKAIGFATKMKKILDNFPIFDDEIILEILFCGIRFGINESGKINAMEKSLITMFISNTSSDAPDDEMITEIITENIEESEESEEEGALKLIESIFRQVPEFGVTFFAFAACFAYADGIFEDSLKEKISDMITNVQLSDIITGSASVFMGSPEDFLNSDDE